MKGTKAVAEKSARLTLKELPFFNYTGNLIQIHGQFNNSLSTFCRTKRDLDKLTCLYDLHLFTLNTVLFIYLYLFITTLFAYTRGIKVQCK